MKEELGPTLPELPGDCLMQLEIRLESVPYLFWIFGEQHFWLKEAREDLVRASLKEQAVR